MMILSYYFQYCLFSIFNVVNLYELIALIHVCDILVLCIIQGGEKYVVQ